MKFLNSSRMSVLAMNVMYSCLLQIALVSISGSIETSQFVFFFSYDRS